MNQNRNKRIELLAHGGIGKALFTLSAPAILGMVVMAVYNIVDTFFVSLLRDTTSVAAIGIVFPMFQLVGAVGLTFGMGAASVISRRLGEDNRQAANEAGATAFYSALAVGIALAVTGSILIEPLLRLFGATESILATATLYGRVIISGSVFQVLNMTANNMLRAEGASLHSSMGQMTGALLNMALDPIFIFVLGMGVTGAAVATVISQGVTTIVLLSYYVLKRGVLAPLRPGFVRLTRGTYRALMTLGIPTFVRQVLGSISFGILNNAAKGYGDQAIAAVSITIRLFMLMFMVLVGLAQGAQPLVGYNYGAKRYDRVHASMRLTFTVAAMIGVVAGAAAFAFAPGIIRVFTPQDAAVIGMGTIALRLISVTLVPVAMVLMFGGVFQALGDGRSALLLAAGQQGLFLIPLVLILPQFLGINGVFAAQPAGFTLAFLVGLLLLRRAAHRLRREESLQSAQPSAAPTRSTSS